MIANINKLLSSPYSNSKSRPPEYSGGRLFELYNKIDMLTEESELKSAKIRNTN
jgi:hypothetical protein